MLPALQTNVYKIKMIFISVLSCFPVQKNEAKWRWKVLFCFFEKVKWKQIFVNVVWKLVFLTLTCLSP